MSRDEPNAQSALRSASRRAAPGLAHQELGLVLVSGAPTHSAHPVVLTDHRRPESLAPMLPWTRARHRLVEP